VIVKPVHIIGVSLDLGGNRRGVDMGPSAFRIAGLSERLTALGMTVIDEGDLVAPIPEVTRLCEKLYKTSLSALEKGGIPLVLGGDHSLAAGSVAATADYMRREDGRLGLIWVDAHGDMNTPASTASGNVHGMPLASLLGPEPAELARIGGFSPKVRPENTALIGIRNLDEREKGLVRSSGVRAYTMSDLDRRGVGAVLDEVLAALRRTSAGVHLSLDLDGLDPEVAPGVGTPVRGGLSYREAHLLCEMVAEDGRLTSLDVVELNPTLDVRNHSAEVGAELILSALGQRIL